MKPITCSQCKTTIPPTPPGHTGGTGYGLDRRRRKVCYPCCAKRDAADLAAAGPGPVRGVVLYLARKEVSAAYTDRFGNRYGTGYTYEVTNWPGSLRVPCAPPRLSWHNIAGKDGRRDVWFTLGGERFHGVGYGWGEDLRVRKLRSKEKAVRS